MKRVFILVEGQTEETFVNEVLGPYLLGKNIIIIPVIVYTSRAENKKKSKGGGHSFRKIENDLSKLLWNKSVVAVTTMFDFYAITSDFPSYSNIPAGNCYTRVKFLEQEFENKINNRKFIPYIAIHEFEALIFVAPEILLQTFSEEKNKKTQGELEKIKNKYSSPEEINEGHETAPSKRLKKLFPGYKKTIDGPLITLEIGLDPIRAICPHFNEWLTKLEVIGSNS